MTAQKMVAVGKDQLNSTSEPLLSVAEHDGVGRIQHVSKGSVIIQLDGGRMLKKPPVSVCILAHYKCVSYSYGRSLGIDPCQV
mgnify:CR=1 FL=1